MLRAVVCDVQIIGLRGIFGGEGVYLFNVWRDAQCLAVFAHFEHIGGDVNGCMLIDDFCDLEVGESGAFEFAHKVVRYLLDVAVLLSLFAEVEDVFQSVYEPLVYLGEVVDLVHCKTIGEGVGNGKNPHIRRLGEFLLDVVDVLVGNETVHTLTNHPQTLLYCLLEGASDSHNLADRLHRRADFLADADEFVEVPTRDFHHAVVQRRFKASRSYLCDSVFEFVETVSETEFGGDECKRVARCLGCQCRRAREPCVDLDDAVVLAVGVEGVLYVTFAHDADVADDFDCNFAEFVELGVCKSLTWSHND